MFSPDSRRAMRRLLWRIVWLMSAWLGGAVANAQDMAAARAAWTGGDFLAAAEIAAGLGTSDGYALAAESLATHGYFRGAEEELEELYREAVRHGEEAVRLNPESVYANIQFAHAMGRLAETSGVLEALSNGYAQRVRDSLEAAAELDPESPLAHSGIAMWHAGALDEAGLIARTLFGASRSRALEHIDLALDYDTGSKLVLHDAAVALILLSERRYGDRARELLLTARDLPQRDARDGFIQLSIVDILAQLDD